MSLGTTSALEPGELPCSWYHYDKIIAGSENSKFDFAYIAEFNYERWATKIGKTDWESVNIEDYVELLIQKHVEWRRTERIDLKGLEEVLASLKETMKKVSGETFIRLSYRSPKDVPEARLPVTSPQQILRLIIKSERCYDDLIAHHYHRSRGVSLFPLNIVLTPWDEKRYPQRELRCFIFRGKLVAITNQFPDDRWPFKGVEVEIMHILNQYVNEMWQCSQSEHLTPLGCAQRWHPWSETEGPTPPEGRWLLHPDLYESAVVDIEINAHLEPTLIEFNPYGRHGSTSPGLFDWEKDGDILFPVVRDKIILRWNRQRWRDIVVSTPV
jgi:hypothetical protein